ncbi:phosphatase PAP2 family protein [Haoranjiania flava]|uniref:Phosphatase PAP2 family protein n=1 Tax=Haoranjiania flava TaxID=1856322 RepID=A0AAE3ISR9_9BACT|nr:phosphatase PAP2 family protein [Haoranjiania flava]MCU7695147.1 phosphatase PAP2 family protein [Haoranjiania flava]
MNIPGKFHGISKIWFAVLIYFLIISVLQLIFDPAGILIPELLINRTIYLALFFVLIFFKKHFSAKIFHLLNVAGIYALLTFLYKETATLNTLIFPKIDAQLSLADEALFGFQPALYFSRWCSGCFWSELFFFGYFSYYLMPLIILFLLYKYYPHKIEAFGFVVISSFLVYYVLFILFPAAGPQFYFTYPDNAIDACGVFGHAIQLIQKHGEGPTGAFPSSHVAVSCIMLLWLYAHCRKWIKYFLPVVIILIFSTVYIKAHYVVDVVAGIVTAPLIYWATLRFYKSLLNRMSA